MNMELKGKILNIETKSGVTDNKAWKKYTYQMQTESMGKRFMSTFKEFKCNIGDEVIVTYSEKPNELKPDFPYLTINDMKPIGKIVIDSGDSEQQALDPDQKFLDEYNSEMKKKGRAGSLHHFIGTYVVNNNIVSGELIAKLTKLYNKK